MTTMRRERAGLTLVELLAVIAIIGLLVALLLPAVQSAREAARRVSCSNNLRQIGIGVQSHIAANGTFPTNGWGWAWLGDPDRGVDWRQPGGWIFNTLPFVDQLPIHQLQSGKTGDDRWTAAVIMMQTPIAVLNCPSRRPAQLTRFGGGSPLQSFSGKTAPSRVAKSDYACNAGTLTNVGGPSLATCPLPATWTPLSTAPPSYAAGVDAVGASVWSCFNREMTGVAFVGSAVTPAHVRDGLTFTYLGGEKYLNPDQYDNGGNAGDNESMYIGDNADTCRWVSSRPLQDTRGVADYLQFGSAHATQAHMLFCDGAVRPISYEISIATHRQLGNRRDGQVLDTDAF